LKKKILALVAIVVSISALVAPTAVLAATTGGTDVGGDIPADILEVTAPSAITLGDLYGTAADVEGTSATPGTVLCTYEGGHTLTLESDDAAGKLILVAENLDAALKVTAVLETGTGATATSTWTPDAAATTTPVNVGTTAAPAPETGGTNSITLSVAQPPQVTGTAGAYSITLTWTVTSN